MNRRNFLSLLSSGVAGIALKEAIPFNRVWSFPKQIVIANSFPVGPLNRFTLQIGDVVEVADWDDIPFVVSRVLQDEKTGDAKFDLYRPNLLMRGVQRYRIVDAYISTANGVERMKS